MKTRYKILVIVLAIPVGLFALVFGGATLMSLTNTGYYYTPTEEELPTETMIESANALPITHAFLEKYPSTPIVPRGVSVFGVHYQAYPDVDSTIDPNFSSDGIKPYVALIVPFTDDKEIGKPYIYCVPNYVRTERVYEQDYDRFYKVQSHEDILSYLQDESCFLTKEMVGKSVAEQWSASYHNESISHDDSKPENLDDGQ